MNVWLVEVGEYEDRSVIAVAASLDAAKAVIETPIKWECETPTKVYGRISRQSIGYIWHEDVTIEQWTVVE